MTPKLLTTEEVAVIVEERVNGIPTIESDIDNLIFTLRQAQRKADALDWLEEKAREAKSDDVSIAAFKGGQIYVSVVVIGKHIQQTASTLLDAIEAIEKSNP